MCHQLGKTCPKPKGTGIKLVKKYEKTFLEHNTYFKTLPDFYLVGFL